MTTSEDLKRRILEAARAEPVPTRRAVRRRACLLLGACAAIALAIFVYFGGFRQYDRPTLLVLWTSFGWGATASAAAWMGMARGQSMVGRTRGALIAVLVAVPALLLAWKIGVTIFFAPEMTQPWPGRPGFRCLGLSIAMACPLLLALLVFRRRSDPVHPAIAGSVLGVTAGVFAGTLVDLWCPVAFVPHVLLGHILPLVVVAAVGAWAGRRVLSP
jgi:hypothetical protein